MPSGSSEVADVLPIVKVLPYPTLPNDIALLKGVFCYIVEWYAQTGLSCLVDRKNGNRITIGDWAGNTIDLSAEDSTALLARLLVQQHAGLLLDFTKTAGVEVAQYYFVMADSTKFRLVDVRVSANKFLGPGMVRDVFGQRFDTQRVIKIDYLTEQLVVQIERRIGHFGNGVIIKPSRFVTMPDVGIDGCVKYVEIKPDLGEN